MDPVSPVVDRQSGARCARFLVAAILLAPYLFGGPSPTGATESMSQQEARKPIDSDEFSYLEDARNPQTTAWIAARNSDTMTRLAQGARFERYVHSALEAAAVGNQTLGAANPGASLNLDHGWLYQLFSDVDHPRGIWRRIRLEHFANDKAKWETLLDIDELALREGKKWTFVPLAAPSPDGKRWLLALSNGGWSTYEWREFDIERKAFVAEGFQLPPAQRGTVAWLDDNTILAASDFGSGTLSQTGIPITVRRWSRGQPVSAATNLFDWNAQDYQVALKSETDCTGTRYILVNRLRPGDTSFWLVSAEGSLKRMSLPPFVTFGTINSGQFIFQTPEAFSIGPRTVRAGSLLSMPMSAITTTRPPVEIVREADDQTTIWRPGATRSGLLVTGFKDASGLMWRMQYRNGRWHEHAVPLPAHGTIRAALQSAESDSAFVVYESFLQPQTLYRIDVAANVVTEVARKPDVFDSRELVTEQLEARSADGTLVPYFLTRSRSSKSSGRIAPTIVRGYGAWKQNESPLYSGALGKLWLMNGGAYVVANVRGGGERGPQWHVTRAERRHTYEDMEAVLEDLVQRKVTAPKHIGVVGQSAGGLLAGVMLTRRPDLLGAAILEVAPLDQFRLDLSVRAPAQTAAEYGSPDIPAERAFLAATSPFQNLRRHRDFPAPLVITSSTDETVSPAHSRRFAAKLAELNLPFFFYESSEGSHGMSSNVTDAARIEAMKYSYLTQRLIDPFQGS